MILCVLLTNGQDCEFRIELMNLDIKTISSWLIYNRLSLEKNETVYLTSASGIDIIPTNTKVIIDIFQMEKVN